MNKDVEKHILLLIGASSRNTRPQNNVTLNERLLYMIMFLAIFERPDLELQKLYKFKKADPAPQSTVLRDCLRNPHYYRNCWEITETGIALTPKKGIITFRTLIAKHTPVFEMYVGMVQQITEFHISEIEMETFIQLKYPDWVGKYDIEHRSANNISHPNMTEKELREHIKSREFIHETIKRVALTKSYDMKKKFLLDLIGNNSSNNGVRNDDI